MVFARLGICINCGAAPPVHAGPPGPARRVRNQVFDVRGRPTRASASGPGGRSAPQFMQDPDLRKTIPCPLVNRSALAERLRAHIGYNTKVHILRGIVSPRTFFRLFTHIQMMPILESGEETLVGGQAVIEGVMMRAPHSYCVAVRKPNGEIVTEEKPLARMSEMHRIFKYPILRGIGTLYQAMSLGLKALKFSANAILEAESQAPQSPGSPKSPINKEVSNWAITLNLIFSLAFFIFLYKFIPLY